MGIATALSMPTMVITMSNSTKVNPLLLLYPLINIMSARFREAVRLESILTTESDLLCRTVWFNLRWFLVIRCLVCRLNDHFRIGCQDNDFMARYAVVVSIRCSRVLDPPATTDWMLWDTESSGSELNGRRDAVLTFRDGETTIHCVIKLHDCHITYACPYVNRMLKRNPLGKEFLIIIDVILRHKHQLLRFNLERSTHSMGWPEWGM